MKSIRHIALTDPQKVLFEITRCSNDIVILADWNKNILYANPSTCLKTGYRLKELVGQRIPILYRKENQAKYAARISKGLHDAGRWNGEVELQRKDGSTFWMKTVIFVYCDDRGKPAGTFGIGRDLSCEKLLVQRSMEEENRLQQVIESMEDAVCVCDTHGKILMVNSAHGRMLGYRKEELVGVKPPYPWVDPGDVVNIKVMLKRIQKESSVKNVPLVWRRRDNRRLVVSVAMSRYVNPSHGIDGQVCTFRDITDVQHVEELRQANEQIQRLVFDIKQKAVRLQTLEETNTLVLRHADVKRIFHEIIDGVKKLVQHDLAGIYVHDAKHERLIPHTLSKQTPFSRKLAKFPLQMGEGIIGEAAVSGEMVWVNNAHLDPRAKYPEGMKPEREHFVAVPLKSKHTTFGILVVARNRDPQFIEEDVNVIKSFADAASVALENSRMICELTQEEESVFADVMDKLTRRHRGAEPRSGL